MACHFRHTRQSQDSRADFIICQEMGLEIEVVSGMGEVDSPTDLILTAIWYHRNPDGHYDPELT